MSGNWVAVAAAEHVRRGRAAGFMQVCHGKAAPLRRMQPDDRVAYYSPTAEFRGRAGLKAFTAIGVVRDREPYQVDMGGGFRPFRRDVDWLPGVECPIAPLLDHLEFAAGRRNWGYQLRFGLFAISTQDMAVIAAAMQALLPRGLPEPPGRAVPIPPATARPTATDVGQAPRGDRGRTARSPR